MLNIRKHSPGDSRDRRLSPKEERLLLAAVNRHSNPMLGGLFASLWKRACAPQEISSLRRPQVDLAKRVIRLSDTKNDGSLTVPLGKRATEVFKAAIDNPVRPIDCNLVFFGEPGKDGKRRPYTFTKIWGQLKKRLDLPDFRFHDLRHEAVSRLVEGGMSDQKVAAISGHKSMQMLRR